ncbi:hypothetical protein BDV95DRAFT_605517 [Massariosphaeria phaeospora]|uniref:Actin-like ATPase domain-containing protein n=1 Tax=Massariosphaeria phaeospora TaxID=100035 RepID=A0A7C8I7Y5_9PLEO|nr:hypothetical protein BDV95DRAFT_605517 [Massariosphaeria phaeospora]
MPLMRNLLLLTTALGVAAWAPDRFYVPGVAFELKPDYGLASIYFANGTSVPVAQIQGRPGYQAFMRRATPPPATSPSTLCSYLTPELQILASTLRLQVDFCESADVSSTKALLTSLKTAVESYLGTNICFAELGLFETGNYVDPPRYQVNITKEALRAIGLRQTQDPRSASTYAVSAHMAVDGRLNDAVIFAVDYSVYGFSFGLYTTEEGIFELVAREQYHYAPTPAPLANAVANPDEDEPTHLATLRTHLRDFLVDQPVQIEHLVLYGDRAQHAALRPLLASVLNADLVRNAHISRSVFAGTTLMAKSAYESMDTPDLRVDAAFGCRWRSKLYRPDPDQKEL